MPTLEQEAINRIKHDVLPLVMERKLPLVGVMDIACMESLVKRMTPTSPLEIMEVESVNMPKIIRLWYGRCPNCGIMIFSKDNNYFHDVKDCGQALKWRKPYEKGEE